LTRLQNVPSPRWLDTADDLARALIDAALPVRFELARTAEQLEEVFRLRYRVSVEKGWREPADLPDGLERDEYDDENAAQIAGWDGPRLAATARVVYPVAGRPLPTEAAFDIVVEPSGRVVDTGRAIVAPEYRDGTHRVLGGLSASVWVAMTARNHRWAAVTATRKTLDFFEHLGFDATVLGPPRMYWGEERYPARFSAPDPRLWSLTNDDSLSP
jgi:N-acyl-L-homoserine lactone synthetase